MHAYAEELAVRLQDDAGGSLRGTDWAGLAATVTRLAPRTDHGPLLAQVPGGACPVPHRGYMIEGSIAVHYANGEEETVEAGQVFYIPAHHDRVSTEAGALFAEFSPAGAARDLTAQVGKVMNPGVSVIPSGIARPSPRECRVVVGAVVGAVVVAPTPLSV